MSDPKRWRDGGAPSEVSELLSAGRRSGPMPAGVRARSAARVARIGVAPLGAGVMFFWTKALIAGAAVGVATVFAYKVIAPIVISEPPAVQAATGARLAPGAPRGAAGRAKPPAAVEEMKAPAASEEIVPPAPPARELIANGGEVAAAAGEVTAKAENASADKAAEPPSTRATAPAVRSAGATPPPPTPADDLTREASLLEEARGLLASHPGAALTRADLHAKEFRNGQLTAERELIAIDALRRLGRLDDAQVRGNALLRRFPDGIYAERVRKILGGVH